MNEEECKRTLRKLDDQIDEMNQVIHALNMENTSLRKAKFTIKQIILRSEHLDTQLQILSTAPTQQGLIVYVAA